MSRPMRSASARFPPGEASHTRVGSPAREGHLDELLVVTRGNRALDGDARQRRARQGSREPDVRGLHVGDEEQSQRDKEQALAHHI